METVVSARHLGKTVGGKALLRDISVDVAQGDIVGVIGKNGAGKTTLLEILLGFSPATAGTATLFGSDSFNLPASVKRRIGFVPQQDELVNQLTGAQQLALNASLHRHWDGAVVWQGTLDALKESVVRLDIRGRGTLPAALGIPDVLSQRNDGRWANLVVGSWDPEQAGDLARRLDAEILVENLSLEDIFVEFHA